ncbi:MAG: hypothetical protein GF350_10195, partial [Chitinivibrionales bacterium]|nr:hypothetical protein [Chitinivibrionales bacterium]
MDCIITGIKNPHASAVLARNLARDPNISLEKARSMLETLPVTYLSNVSQSEAEEALMRLHKLGVTARIIKSDAEPALGIEQNVTWNRQEQKKVPPKQFPQKKSGVVYGARASAPVRFGVSAANKPKRKIHIAKFSGGIVVLFVVGLLFYFYSRSSDTYRVSKNGPLKMETGKSSGENSRKKAGKKTDRPGKKNSHQTTAGNNPSPAQKSRATAYTDSAKAGVDILTSIKFYKIAISFNKYNIDAWYGLINAYSEVGMVQERQAARSEMRELFGNNVFSLTGIIKRFGQPGEIFRAEDGLLRIQYLSREREEEALT